MLQVTNLANASSLIFNSLLAFPAYFGAEDNKAVNWCGKCPILIFPRLYHKRLGHSSDRKHCVKSADSVSSGFYVDSRLFPLPRGTTAPDSDAVNPKRLLLGPFCGKPACQFINTDAKSARGVCADAFLGRQTLVVPDVNSYPGHIACDGGTKSEIVCPLFIRQEDGSELPVGVLDLDCLAPAAFDEEDKLGLERISKLVVSACDW